MNILKKKRAVLGSPVKLSVYRGPVWKFPEGIKFSNIRHRLLDYFNGLEFGGEDNFTLIDGPEICFMAHDYDRDACYAYGSRRTYLVLIQNDRTKEIHRFPLENILPDLFDKKEKENE